MWWHGTGASFGVALGMELCLNAVSLPECGSVLAVGVVLPTLAAFGHRGYGRAGGVGCSIALMVKPWKRGGRLKAGWCCCARLAEKFDYNGSVNMGRDRTSRVSGSAESQ